MQGNRKRSTGWTADDLQLFLNVLAMAGASYRLAAEVVASQSVYMLKKQAQKWANVLSLDKQCNDPTEAASIVLHALGTVLPPTDTEFEVDTLNNLGKVKVYLSPHLIEDEEAVQATQSKPDVMLTLSATRTMWHVQRHFFNKWGLPIILLKPDGDPLSPNEIVAAVVENLGTKQDSPGTVHVDYRVLHLNPSTVLNLTSHSSLELPPTPLQQPMLPPEQLPLPPPLPPRRLPMTDGKEKNENNKRKLGNSSKDAQKRKRIKKCSNTKDISRREANRAYLPMPPPPPSLPPSDESLSAVKTPGSTRRVQAHKPDDASDSGSVLMAKLQARMDSLLPESEALETHCNLPSAGPGSSHGPSMLSRGDSLAMHANALDFETKETSRDLCVALGTQASYDISRMFRDTSKGPMYDDPATTSILRFAANGSAPSMNASRGKEHHPVEHEAVRVNTPTPDGNDTSSKDAAATVVFSKMMNSVSKPPVQSNDVKMLGNAPEDVRFSLPAMSSDIMQQNERAIKSTDEGAAAAMDLVLLNDNANALDGFEVDKSLEMPLPIGAADPSRSFSSMFRNPPSHQ